MSLQMVNSTAVLVSALTSSREFVPRLEVLNLFVDFLGIFGKFRNCIKLIISV